MKKLIDNIKFQDTFLSSILSVIITIGIYNYIYKYCTYSNLNDFFIGTSIYLDYNKHFDILIYFVYLILFFSILPSICILRMKIFNKEKKKKEIIIKEKKTPILVNYIKEFLLKNQFIGVLGFIFLHPNNGQIYPIVLIIISTFILISIYDVWKIKTKDNNNRFSLFIITAVIFALIYNAYNITYGPTDDHHFGEKFATFFMHNNFNLEYYKDIMLVHGYIDVIPSWIGCYIFNENNIYGYCLGEILFRNLLLIGTIFSGLIIFDKNKLFIAPLLFFKATNPTVFFATTYLLLIKEQILNNYFLWLLIYTIISFIFCMYWTTIGTFWTIASLPILLYQIHKIYKKTDDKKIIKIVLALLPLIILICLMHSTIFEYLKEAPEYMKGNLLAFGNSYGKLTLWLPRLIVCTYKLFALLFIPVLIIEFIKQINKENNTNSIFFLSFTIIFPLISLSYILGRVDSGEFFRTEHISQAYVLLFLPYFLYKFSKKNFNKMLVILLTGIILYSMLQIPKKTNKEIIENLEHKVNNVGNIALIKDYENRIINIKNFVENNSKKDAIFLDLTNRGMHYLYLNKKVPIKFVSFYNAITTKQSNEVKSKLENNPPDIILIDSNSIIHDDIHLSLRLNSLYRWLLLSKMYSITMNEGNIFLLKQRKEINYTENDKNILDNIWGCKNLNYLPEAWGNSIKTLPLIEITINGYSYTDRDRLIINFLNIIQGTDIDFIYIEPENKIKEKQSYYVQINSSNSGIFYKTKKNGKVLIPFDNYPSWTLSNSIKEIIIYSDKEFKGKYKIKFYKRKT